MKNNKKIRLLQTSKNHQSPLSKSLSCKLLKVEIIFMCDFKKQKLEVTVFSLFKIEMKIE